MAGIILYPYARLNSDEVRWGSPSYYLDGVKIEPSKLARLWDAKSQLRVESDISVSAQAIRRVGRSSGALVTMNVSCKDTARNFNSSAGFISDKETMSARVEVQIAGHEVAQRLDLNIAIVMPVEGAEGAGPFKRRIIAEENLGRVFLDSEVDGFPTSAYSFKSHRLPDAPWRIVISAEDLEATFVHSVRLHLNEDYDLVQELIDGRPKPLVEQELTASIARVLIATVSRLACREMILGNLDSMAGYYPDSVAAAAQNVAHLYLNKTLDGAVSEYRNSPEEFEYKLSVAVGLMKGR